MDQAHYVQLIERFGSLVILGWIVYYSLTHALPAAQATLEKTLKEVQEAYLGQMAAQRESFFRAAEEQRASIHSHSDQLEKLSATIEQLSVILIKHDAQVRGHNPDILGTTEDLFQSLRDLRRAGA